MSYELQPLQIALIALLPKTGEPLTVAELAKACAVEPAVVVSAMLMPYMAFHVDFDVLTDSYTLRREGDELLTELPSERTQA